MQKQFLAWSWPVLWMVLIFISSHQPAGVSGGISSAFARELFAWAAAVIPLEFEALHTLLRKSAHFFAYAVLALLLAYALKTSGLDMRRAMLFAFFGSVLYAVSDEIHQLYIPGRSGEVRDVLIDTAGAAFGLASYRLGLQVRWRQKEKAGVSF